MSPIRRFAAASLCAVCVLAAVATAAASPAQKRLADSDQDGLSDALEQALLVRFVPSFEIDPEDCAGQPALFAPGRANPTPESEDGTIYGEATPRIFAGKSAPLVELRYFHLWRSDCGRMSHRLDAEHVSVLAQKESAVEGAEGWRAVYWYAAAHEDTACDASQITRAKTLRAENGGATVWISRGKHASFLNRDLCSRGCGGDDCRHDQTLAVPRIVNLGEAANPMNGSVWSASAEWPLAAKLERSDFSPESLARLERLPDSDIAWVYPSKRPEQAAIAAGNSTADALEMSNRKTDTAISLAEDKTGNALATTHAKVKRSLRNSARNVWNFLSGGGAKKVPGGGSGQAGKP
jgi:hypothetical protein